jgi:hypothetical protein
MKHAENIPAADCISSTTVEELVLCDIDAGLFNLAFEIEYHDALQSLTLDWLVRDKITSEEAREMFFKFRAEWTAKRQIDPSVWSRFPTTKASEVA